ncbi:DUF4173 domain-containing protein [Nonlabens sp. MB-3u-79]|uniref:DUF4153 domain-containing protein n=1 Tax=Nonlabens sp. MB-3u-79 TaxID=2058134 RepID=UPI000C3159C2|nr:DUF4173 domain-containing protein [Nonlabens sp. MB-3u-79]AUC79307.1 DUF4173 domain-containing protein [Nonlabens sp. MB-3u-79]
MKKTILITAGGLVFATLFYTQSLGINALIYSIFLIGALAISRKKMLLKSSIILSGTAMLSSALAISIHGSTWSMTAYFLSTLLYIGYVASFQSSIYVSWLNGCYNAVFGVFHSFFYQLEPPKIGEPKKKIATGQVLKLIGIPLVLVVVFSVLYSSSNPVFHEVLTAIDFSFIDVFWIFTAVLGAFIIANIHDPQPIKELTARDQNYPNQLVPQTLNDAALKSVANESQIGFISLLCLNSLLCIVLITEILFLSGITNLEASSLSDAVHQGVNASIVSIVLALGVIAFIFRGDVNFLKNNQKLRTLTYIWIGLNALLVVSICIKNYIYIQDHGLTHKRIGVMIYLFLTLIGLCTTYLKVTHRLNFVYLLRRNMAIGYASIVIYALINWSAIITDHNIKANKIDQPYLERLLPQNALVLKEQDLYELYSQQKSGEKYLSDRYNEAAYTNRNWQEFNWIAHQLQLDHEDSSQ